jgi:mannose-6-phosphate isomerase-like protein (cupin superfamily)
MTQNQRGTRLALMSILGALVAVAPMTLRASDDPTATQVKSNEAKAQEHADHAVNARYENLKWERIVPELGEKSSEITILRVHPETKATHLMIRVPPNTHIPMHWHTANETHTIVKGTFIMECEGKREVLGPGSWNYIPSKMHHQAWTKPDEGTLLFITVDSGWDVNWVNGPPKPADFLGGRKD